MQYGVNLFSFTELPVILTGYFILTDYFAGQYKSPFAKEYPNKHSLISKTSHHQHFHSWPNGLKPL